jgi:hypothetical protein
VPTPFVYTTFAVITALNSAGQLAPVDKADLPAGTAGPILFTEAQCNFVRGKMANPEKYVCQIFTSPTETKLVYATPGFVMPAEALEHHSSLCTLEDNHTPCVKPEGGEAIEGQEMQKQLEAVTYELLDKPYSDKWISEASGLTLQECLAAIKDREQFHFRGAHCVPSPSNGPEHRSDAVDIGPTALQEADKPFIEPLVASPVREAPKPKEAEAPKPKKVAQQRHEQQAMLDGNPLTGFVAMLTGNW